MTGDRRSEIAIGVPHGPKGGAPGRGEVDIVFAAPGATVVRLDRLRGIGRRILGLPARAHDLFGELVSAAGDVNGDGRPDVLAGGSDAARGHCRFAAGTGAIIFGGRAEVAVGAAFGEAVVFVRGRTAPGTIDVARPGAWGFRVQGGVNDGVGFAGAGTGDFDGDGRPDVVVGAARADPHGRCEAGSVYIISPPPSAAGAVLRLPRLNATRGRCRIRAR